MKARIEMCVVVVLSLFCLVVPPAFGQAAEAGDASDVLTDIRAAMAARDLPVAKAKLEEAAKIEGNEAFVGERERLLLLFGYLEDFWKAVDQGSKSLLAAEELVIGEVRAAAVEFHDGVLVLRVAGQNHRYTLKTLPPKVALTLAQRVVKPDDPQNKAYFAAFLLLDGRGDRELAAQFLAEAQKANVDVTALLPEMKVAPVATVPIEIPPVTPIMRKLLAPASWYLRRQEGNRIVRDTLKTHAEQTAEGHLKLAVPPEAGAAQLVYSRKLTGNFGCRVILQNVGDSQAFGLWASDLRDAGYQVPLPKGSVLIEFARQAGAFQCRINQKEVAVEARGDVTPNMPGMLGVTVLAGKACVVAWFELQGR